MNLDKDMQEVLATFIIESSDLLQDMEAGLMAIEHIENVSEAEEIINGIFRAAHTIKGSAGIFSLDHIVRFAHVVENLLDALRSGILAVSPELVAALLPCCDHLNVLILEVASGKFEENQQMTACGEQLLAILQPFLASRPVAATGVVVSDAPAGRVETIAGSPLENGNWYLFLQFNENCLRDGTDPLSSIHYLKTLGDIVELTTFSHAMPEVDSMNPESNYLGFEIVLKTEANKEILDGVFDFIRDGSHIHILPMENRISYYVELIHSLTDEDVQLGELLINSGAITPRELEEGLKAQQVQSESQQTTSRIGEILVDNGVVQQPLVNAALEKQQQFKDNKERENQSIRVDAYRLDKLIDLVGELVIATAAANLRGVQTGDRVQQEANAAVINLVENVRGIALQLRMVPVGTVFNRFQRVVHDVSKELGKNIKLVISGTETEVDKAVAEKIGDPLLHLVRNAMDHGIECAELRAERDKPVQGLLQLNAYHNTGNIVIEISDDGGGLNRDKILAKAIERGLVQPGVTLSDQDINMLIFEPGFSTAEQISSLSGRGVGMDVVKRNVIALRGSIDVDSQVGIGTTMRIYLPLTLAIIDGFLVGIGSSTFVIPLDRIVECVTLPNAAKHSDYMDLRGEVLPLIRLGTVFNVENEQRSQKNVVVVELRGNKTGLVVERLQGEFQTVIKPLGKLFAHIKGVAGSTILGNGKVALILDIPSFLEYYESLQRAEYALPNSM